MIYRQFPVIPPEAAAKTNAGSRKTDQVGTCGVQGCRQLEMVERAACGQDKLQDKGLCKSSRLEKAEHVRKHCHQNKTKQNSH